MTKKIVPYIDHHHIASSATNTHLPLDEWKKKILKWMDSHRAMTHDSESMEIS